MALMQISLTDEEEEKLTALKILLRKKTNRFHSKANVFKFLLSEVVIVNDEINYKEEEMNGISY